MITIDGSLGEGGGQVLRSSLTLSILTHQPIHLTHIRAGRAKPGLQPQHLQAVKAAAAVCAGSFEGGQAGSQTLRFWPGEVRPGRYTFEIGTAGATSLVLQTIFLPLTFADGDSTVTIRGGTHVPWSPSFHYLDWQWLPHLRQMGCAASLQLTQAGFYPRGGGEIKAVIQPAGPLKSWVSLERGMLQRISGLSAVANLDESIAQRQKLQALRRLEPICQMSKIRSETLPSPGKGTTIILLAELERARLCASALGEPGKRAERVADEAAEALERSLNSSATVDEHLADQLLLPLALAAGRSQFCTPRVTQHLLTNAAIIRQFLPVQIDIRGESGQEGIISVSSLSPSNESLYDSTS